MAVLESDVATARAAAEEQEALVSQAATTTTALQAELSAARQEADDLTGALRAMTVGGHDPATLWALELARSERTWRQEVALHRDAPSPIVGAANPLRVAVDIEAAAVREEVGTDIHVEWNLSAPVGPGLSLAVLRVVQELLATVAKAAEVVVVRVSDEGDDLVVEVTAVDGDATSVGVDLPVIHAREIETMPGRVRLRKAATTRAEEGSAPSQDSLPAT